VTAVCGVLLAAGAGRRMGGPKALVELGGEPLVRRGVRLLTDGGCDPVVVVVGSAAERVRPLCDGVQVVEATGWATGMAASLQAGLGAAVGDACVVALVDQPGVTPAAVARLRAAHRDGAPAAVATYAGRPRNPVLLDRSVWAEVAAAAHGDEGARPWLRAHPDRVVQVDCSDVGSPDDVDTPQDLAAWAAVQAPPDPSPQPHAREAAR
jgi:CTP:molybdopterin cytidylyltransferase MocA